MQTDPNFASYRFQPDSGNLMLLDFGAIGPVAGYTAEADCRLLLAALDQDHDRVRDAALSAARRARIGQAGAQRASG